MLEQNPTPQGRRWNRKRPSLATLIALVAVVIALTSNAGALPGINKVESNDIKKNAVTGPKIKKNAVTSKKIKNGKVKTADLAPSARGAKVIQYVADGSVLDTQDSATVQLPGTWNASSLGNSSWSVELVRNAGPVLFVLGSSAPAGETAANGFYITVTGGVASVNINAPSYNFINTIRVVRTVRTGTAASPVARPQKVAPRAAG